MLLMPCVPSPNTSGEPIRFTLRMSTSRVALATAPVGDIVHANVAPQSIETIENQSVLLPRIIICISYKRAGHVLAKPSHRNGKREQAPTEDANSLDSDSKCNTFAQTGRGCCD